jgi:hypothetical protein
MAEDKIIEENNSASFLKRRPMTSRFINPFTYVAGINSLLIGLIIMLLTTVVSYYGNIQFNGVIDMHFINGSPVFLTLIMQQVVVITVLTVVFTVLGWLTSKSNIRIIDIAGTLLLSRAVLLPMALLMLLIPKAEISDYLSTLASNPETVHQIALRLKLMLAFLFLIMVPGIIWMIALMYNAYRVSCNVKGSTATVSFIAGILLAELLSVWLMGVFLLNL